MAYEQTAATVTFIHDRPESDEPRKIVGKDNDVVLDPDKEVVEGVETEPDVVIEEDEGAADDVAVE